ncbi:MAG: DEAD/DEAH box helicase [Jatrophihabitans sp.]|nr:MAG: DEAD/DEAH box helicase [Jatrophihabitans sp.]
MTDREQLPGFDTLGLSAKVLRALGDVGYEVPSPIQARTIPLLLAGSDVVGLAQTGTGKTAAFALPILSRIDVALHAPQALVLAPTRELVLQVAEAFGTYAAHLRGVQVLPIYGGAPYGPQLAGLRRGAQVVVGTPGRVIDHLENRALDLANLRYVVLDEADEMLRMGFQEEVERILSDAPAQRRTALFSATMPAAIKKISRRYLRDPVKVTIKTKTATVATTRQRFLLVTGAQKMEALTRILEVEPFEAMIVFVRTKAATEDVAARLRSRGFAAQAISGDLSQVQRERVVAHLRDGSLDLVVATDVAARGLDVDRVSHVVNYDIPTDVESYVHRVGRTGRAGRSGEAVLFVTPREQRLLEAIEKTTRQRLTEMALPTAADVNAQRVAKFHDAITTALGAPSQSLFKGLVLDYAREHDVPLADIAAALGVMTHQDGQFLLSPDVDARATAGSARPSRKERPARGAGERPQGAGASGAPRPPGRDREYARYRIDVGRRQKVNPSQIVGALLNEGGLDRGQIGKIDIRVDHSTVELPPRLPRSVTQALQRTRISGQLIGLRRAQ